MKSERNNTLTDISNELFMLVVKNINRALYEVNDLEIHSEYGPAVVKIINTDKFILWLHDNRDYTFIINNQSLSDYYFEYGSNPDADLFIDLLIYFVSSDDSDSDDTNDSEFTLDIELT